MLLRSAGIAGLAGVIMAIAAGKVFFAEPPRTASAQSDIAQEAEPSGVIVAASVSADVTPPHRTINRKSQAPAAIEAEESAPASSDAEDALAFYDAHIKEKKGERAESPAARPDAVATGFSLSSPSLYSPSDAAQFQTAAASPASGEEAAAAASMPDPAVQADAEPPQAAAPHDEAQGDADDLWATEAVECPRDWIDTADASMAEGAADCGADVALVAAPDGPAAGELPTGTPDAASEAAPGTDVELELALATQALKLVGFIARVPEARPDPPPVRRVSNRSTSWPDQPPPNCGKLHAYWHFKDRKAGTKEWYCR